MELYHITFLISPIWKRLYFLWYTMLYIKTSIAYRLLKKQTHLHQNQQCRDNHETQNMLVLHLDWSSKVEPVTKTLSNTGNFRPETCFTRILLCNAVIPLIIVEINQMRRICATSENIRAAVSALTINSTEKHTKSLKKREETFTRNR